MADVLPNFLIVGAAKAGTTALYAALRQHPEVFLPSCKEPYYFFPGAREGVSGYEEYARLFRGAGDKKAIGEASVGYLWNPISPQLIRDALGPVKIIILLRDPTRRAFSSFNYMIMHGLESMKTFEQALAAEDQRYADPRFQEQHPDWFFFHLYYRAGLYREQVARYLDLFGSERVAIYLFEDMIRIPEKLYADVCAFLEIATGFRPNWSHENPSHIPRMIGLQRRLEQCERWFGGWPGDPHGLGRVPARFKRWNIRFGRRPALAAQTESILREKYRPEIQRIEALLRRDLSCWRGDQVKGD